MYQVLELDENYSTTRSVIKADPQEMSERVKQSNKPEDKFETVLFLPEGENRQGEGGLRTKGYFKVGGVLSHTGFDPVSPETALVIPVLDMGISKDEGHSGQESETPNPSVISSEAKQFTDTNVIQRSDSDAAISKPLITVITVVFNGEIFLEETILSVINQTYDNVEYIIIDGGSTYGTLDVIRKFEHAIDYWVSEKDKGIYDAMNKGIDLATGDWINFMNAGDTFFNYDSLEKVQNHLYESLYKIVYGDYAVRYSTKVKLGRSGSLNDLWKGSQFSHQSTFISANYHKSNKYNACHSIVGDFEFFYNAKKDSVPFKHIEETVSIVEPVGLSDSSRVKCYIGFWSVVDKNLSVNLYYLKSILWQVIKVYIKKLIRYKV